MNTNQLQDMDDKQRLKNKKRLLTQNKKLNSQIRNLQKDITQILANRQTQMIQIYEKLNNQLVKYRQQIVVQEKYIKKLKGKIDFLKAANTKGNAQFIIKQQNQLLILKKEYENLVIQKSVVGRFKQDKLKILDRDKPFEEHKKQIQDNLAMVRKNNRTMQAQIVELERQVRKYHNYIVLSNSLGKQKKQSNQIQYQITKNEHQIKLINQKCKYLQQKWKSQIESLDKQLFQLKSQFSKTQIKLNEVDKQHRMWQTRVSAIRKQDQVLQFRDRLSKIQLLPQQKLFENMHKSEKKKEKISTSALIQLSKNMTIQQKTREEVPKQQQKFKSLQQPKINEKPLKNQIVKNLGINNKNLRKSDKNIITQEIMNEKQKKKEPSKTQGKKITQNDKLNNKNSNGIKQQNTPKNKEEIKTLQKSKSKQKQGTQVKAKENKKQQPKSNKLDVKNDIKSEKAFDIKNKKNDPPTLNKQKSQAKIQTSTQKNKESPSKINQKSQKQANIDIIEKGKHSTNQKQLNMNTKQSQPTKVQNKLQKSPKADKKQKQKEQKKPVKLLLKSVGVGTQ